MQPSTSLATLRPDLADGLMEFDLAMSRAGFIAHLVAPVLEVQRNSGAYARISIEELLKSPVTDRASQAGYSRSDWVFGKDNFETKEHGHEVPVDARNAEIYGEWVDSEAISAQIALDVVLRNAEIRMAALLFNATTWTGAAMATAITNEWDDAANATPIADVKAAVLKVYDGSGIWPNTLIINEKVFRNLRATQKVIDNVAAAGAGDKVRARDITTAQLAAVFDLDNIFVAGSTQNTANEGQSKSLATIWSDEYAMICRVDGSTIVTPTVARTFHWGADGSAIGGTMESYRDEPKRADIVRARHDVDEKVVYPELGHLLSNVTT